jgi:hypothetical protein
MLPKFREELEGTSMRRGTEDVNGVRSSYDTTIHNLAVLGTNGGTVGTVPTVPLAV